MPHSGPVSKAADPLAGEAFGKYVLVKRLAVGGMAEVCLAQLKGAAGFNKLVVIKQVLPGFAENPQFIEMFLDEGRLAAKLSHPNIAQTFELGEEAGRHYIAMEFVPGESLYSILKRCREKSMLLSTASLLRVEMSLLEALEYAHGLHDESGTALNLVHRDVTPSNVMVTQQGAIKLLDFGIARAATQVHRTEAGRVKGKGGYMAPEQCRSSKVDLRADVYGAGAVLYLMATGMKPFEHLPPGTDMMAQMNATMEGSFLKPREVKKDVHPELEQIILKAMALKADERYQSAGDMLDALEKFSGKVGVFPSPRELGDTVKKLFPHKAEDGIDLTREPSSSRATPGPRRDEKLATVDAPMAQTVGMDEPGTAPSAPAVPAKKRPLSPQVIAMGVGSVALLVFGIALAKFIGGGSRSAEPPPFTPVEAVRQAQPAPAAPAPALAVEEPRAEGPVEDSQPKAARAPQAQPKKKKEKEKERDEKPAPAPKATGTLSINAYPWAKVSLKGKELGVTPLEVSLPPGEYSIVLENPAVQVKKTVKLMVKASEKTQHFEKLAK